MRQTRGKDLVIDLRCGKAVRLWAWHLRGSADGAKDIKKKLPIALRKRFVKDYRQPPCGLGNEAMRGENQDVLPRRHSGISRRFHAVSGYPCGSCKRSPSAAGTRIEPCRGHRAAEPLSLQGPWSCLPRLYPLFAPCLRECGQITRMSCARSGEVARPSLLVNRAKNTRHTMGSIY